jgi:hypothetical protein
MLGVCWQGLETQAYVASGMNSLVFAERTVLLNWFATVTLLLRVFLSQEWGVCGVFVGTSPDEYH